MNAAQSYIRQMEELRAKIVVPEKLRNHQVPIDGWHGATEYVHKIPPAGSYPRHRRIYFALSTLGNTKHLLVELAKLIVLLTVAPTLFVSGIVLLTLVPELLQFLRGSFELSTLLGTAKAEFESFAPIYLVALAAWTGLVFVLWLYGQLGRR